MSRQYTAAAAGGLAGGRCAGEGSFSSVSRCASQWASLPSAASILRTALTATTVRRSSSDRNTATSSFSSFLRFIILVQDGVAVLINLDRIVGRVGAPAFRAVVVALRRPHIDPVDLAAVALVVVLPPALDAERLTGDLDGGFT